MTKKTNQPNSFQTPNNIEGCFTELLGENIERMHSALKDAKKYIDSNTDPDSCIFLLNTFKKAYDTVIVPCLRETYSKMQSDKELFSTTVHKSYAILNELYQYNLKKLESFGITQESLSKKGFPKSLEKLTFPENN